MKKEVREIICRNCSDFKQLPNPELGTCEFGDDKQPPDHNVVYYNSKCILGIVETVEVPKPEIEEN